jgi:phage terminase large subunit
MFKPTQALAKIQLLLKPIRVVEGSQGAGKTVSIIMLLINYCQHEPDAAVTILQYERAKMKRTIVRDFVKIMRALDFWEEWRWNKTESIYSFANGAYLEFMGLDSADVGKGFRRDVIYFNEANRGRITLDTFIQMQSRSAITYADYNPDERFWMHTDILGQDNCDFVRVTFEDNEFIPAGELSTILSYRLKGFHDPDGDVLDPNNILNKYWANKWIVYGLGQPGQRDGTIISDWEIIDSIPHDAAHLGSGCDFGYSQDPTAIVQGYNYNQCLILDEVLFRKGLSISDIAAAVKDIDLGLMWCDSAEPRSIAELRRYGVKAMPAKKGPGSVNAGLDLLRSKRILVTARSKNLIHALKHYAWMQDREGNYLNKPNHLWSDIMDAARYLAYMKLKHKAQDPGSKKYALI